MMIYTRYTNATRYIWLFGENEAKTTNNNSYYFWKYIVTNDDDIAKYLILEKNPDNEQFKKNLPNELKHLIVWRNSVTHFRLYSIADMGFVTLSYLDVVPNKLFNRKTGHWAKFPIIYLQHGVTGQKKLGYKGNAYNNNMFRFIYYNRNIKERLIEENGFRETQLIYGYYFPRWSELIKRSLAYTNTRPESDKKRILWFVTWREYKQGSIEFVKTISMLSATLTSPELTKTLENENAKLTVCFHRQMMKSILQSIEEVNLSERITICSGKDIDVMDEIVQNDILITDYSSIAYDFTLLGKPTILFNPDEREYTRTRKLYYEAEDVADCKTTSLKGLINFLQQPTLPIPRYFRDALPNEIDIQGIADGSYIRRLYDYFVRVQHCTITFVGYNFWGQGGTVSATRALSEALVDKGYAVQMLSLKGKKRAPGYPVGVRYGSFYNDEKSRSRMEQLKRHLYKSKRHFDSIKHDCNQNLLIPYAGHAYRQYLKTSNSAAIVSTRDSLHPELAQSDYSGQKVFFWHTEAGKLEDVFPGLMTDLQSCTFEKSFFTTLENKKNIEALGIHFPSTCVLGNTLQKSQILDEAKVTELRSQRYSDREIFYEENSPIKQIDPTCINCVSLLRLSEERHDALEMLLDFATYLQRNNRSNIKLYLYGSGPLLDKFISETYIPGLNDIVIIQGRTSAPTRVIRSFDFLIDFAPAQSFGMPALEAALNGCIPLCMHNTGSNEILGDLDFCFYNSSEDLEKKLTLKNASNENLYQAIRNRVESKYSPQALADTFLEYVFGNHESIHPDDKLIQLSTSKRIESKSLY